MSEEPITPEQIESAIDSYRNALISGDLGAIVEASDTVIGLYLHCTSNRRIELSPNLDYYCHDALLNLRSRQIVIVMSSEGDKTAFSYHSIE